MAVIAVNELFDGREGNQDQKATRKYTRTWEVLTSDPYDDATIAYRGAGLPAIGAHYVTPNWIDLGAFVTEIKAVQDAADPTVWKCTTSYESRSRVPGSGGNVKSDGSGGDSPTTPGNVNPDPLSRLPIWKGGSSKTKVVVTQALDGDGALVTVMNKAGQPFVPALEAERSYPTITVTVNKPITWLNLVTMYGTNGYDDGVNSVTWKGLGPRTVKIDNLEWEEAFENETNFLKVTWQLSVKFDKWDFSVANLGFFELLGDGTTSPPTDTAGPWRYRKIVDAQGREPTDPVPLDLSGRKLAAGSTPFMLDYRYYREFDFNGVVP